jgi:hypothetical protein
MTNQLKQRPKQRPKPSPQEKASKPREYLAYNMDILKEMIERCDYLYAQKTADISRGLERSLMEGRISPPLYLYYNKQIENLVMKFGEKCRCNKK